MPTKIKSTAKKWIELTTFAVAGIQYHDYPGNDPKLIRRGARVQLVHELSNQFDPKAIKVLLGKRKLGYVPRSMTGTLHAEKHRGSKFYAFINQHFPYQPLHNMLWIKVKVHRVPEGDNDPMADDFEYFD